MINVLDIFASEGGKQLLSRLYIIIFYFHAEECPKDAEDAEVGELCGSAPLHPVRCPDNIKQIVQYLYNSLHLSF